MIDSGGFVLSKSKCPSWDATKVSKFISLLDADIFASLDLPPGLDDGPELRKLKIIHTARNFESLTRKNPNKLIMPVIHGRTLDEIKFSLSKIEQHLDSLRWIALGGVVPLLQQRRASGLETAPEQHIAQTLALMREAAPQANIHVFGAGGTRTFPAVFAFGANSADSIGWRQAAGFGSIFLPFKSQRVVKWVSNKRPPRKTLDDGDMQQIAECNCPICREVTANTRIKLFRKNFHSRAIHNAWVVMNQTGHWPRSRHALKALVANGKLGRHWAEAANTQI